MKVFLSTLLRIVLFPLKLLAILLLCLLLVLFLIVMVVLALSLCVCLVCSKDCLNLYTRIG